MIVIYMSIDILLETPRYSLRVKPASSTVITPARRAWLLLRGNPDTAFPLALENIISCGSGNCNFPNRRFHVIARSG